MFNRRHLMAGAAAFAVLATGYSGGAAAATLAALTGNRTLQIIDTKRPAVVRQVQVGVSGRLLGIDVRPFDGKLYGLVSDNSIVTINPNNGQIQPRSRLSQPLPALMRATVDFNPAADRMRVIGSNGANLRIDVDAGAVTVDTALSLVQPNPFGGTTPSVIAAAYTNNVAGAKATLLFDIDDATDALYLQIPPNMGVLNPVGAQLGISPGQSFGFDIGTDRGGENVPYLISGNRLFRPGLLSGRAFSGRVVKGLSGQVRDVAVLNPN